MDLRRRRRAKYTRELAEAHARYDEAGLSVVRALERLGKAETDAMAASDMAVGAAKEGRDIDTPQLRHLLGRLRNDVESARFAVRLALDNLERAQRIIREVVADERDRQTVAATSMLAVATVVLAVATIGLIWATISG